MTTTSPLVNSENTTTHKQESYNLLANNIEHMLRIPFSQSTFLQYSKSLSQYQKSEITKILKLDLTKKWSDLLFTKKMSIALKKVNSDASMMKQVLFIIAKKMIQPEYTLQEYEQKLERLLQKYDYWSVYWSIYYHSKRQQDETAATELLKTLQVVPLKPGLKQDVSLANSSSAGETTEQQHNQTKLDKKVASLEAKANKEAQLRIQLEQEIAKLEKQNRSLKYEVDKHTQASEQLKQKFNEALQQLEKQEQQTDAMLRKKREEEERWLQERALLLQQIKQLSDESKKQQQVMDQLNISLEESKKQVLSLTQSQNQLQKQKEHSRLEQESSERLIHALQHRLHKRIDRANQFLMNHINTEPRTQTLEDKQHKLHFLKETIALIEHTENYLKLAFVAKPASQETTSLVESPMLPTSEPEEVGYYGTFNRRDHGGYIDLETGESFNITESLVQQLELQHEAEVLCIPNQINGKSSHYTIKIVFQGDDAYSPIKQYDGYVNCDTDGKWYCVEMNEEAKKFPIHFKDIDIQKPSHGDPCTFNVANDGYIARLTKLYRLLPGETYETTFTAKKVEKAKAVHVQTLKEKSEPYLEGCTVTIIGGQRKWFETVVKETGAELVHNGGERPERIASDLARSQALFMILTSTSHRATWEGIEIAKANQIPHFTIQGSKSNLRSLLWENQQLIRETNRQ